MNKLESLYRAFRHRIFEYVMRMTGDYELSRDIMQESFARYFERYGDMEVKPSLLYRIARNIIFDTFRKNSRKKYPNDLDQGSENNAEHQILVREEYRLVMEAMKVLHPEDREILSLSISGDLSYRDIAAITNISEGNIKVKIHRARLKLKKSLKACEES